MSSSHVASGSGGEWPPYGGRGFEQVRGERTGFFHLEQVGGKWWLVDPHGLGFYALAVEHSNYNAGTAWCAPYHESASAKYGSEEAWAEATAARLLAWGFNTLGWGCSESLRYRGLPHQVDVRAEGFVHKDDITPVTTWTGFPNVFSPDWPAHCDERARLVCAPQRDDPWLIGYFLDNELQWFGVMETWQGEFGLVLETWKKPAGHTAKKAWVELVRRHCPTVKDFNLAWQTDYASFDELAASTKPHNPPTEAARKMGREYVQLVAEHYFREMTGAIRRHDPNHMILGVRFAEIAPNIWDICGRYSDVVSINTYPFVHPELGVPRETVEFLRQSHEQAGRPLLIGEWGFWAQEDDVAVPPWDSDNCGSRYFTQKQRARCAAFYQEALLGLPFMVGTSWWMFTDCPMGRSVPEPRDWTCGLVNRRDETCEELTAALVEVHRRAASVHAEGAPDVVYDRPTPVHWSQPLPDREEPLAGKDLRMSSGAFALALGEAGTWNAEYHGRPVGSYRPALCQGPMEEGPIAAGACRVTNVRRDQEFAVVDAEFEGRGPERQGFKAGWRFWAPASSCGWCGAQALWVENVGPEDLHTSFLVHWSRSQPVTSKEPGVLSLANVQKFYLPLGAVDYPCEGVGFGITVVEEAAEFAHHRSREDDITCLSRCRQPLQLILEPGQRHNVDGPVVVLFGYGPADRSGLLAALKEQVEKVRAEVGAFCAP